MSSDSFKVTEKLLNWWRAYYGEVPQCRICGDQFKAGDRATRRSRKTGGHKRRYTRHYHVECWNSESTPYIELENRA